MPCHKLSKLSLMVSTANALALGAAVPAVAQEDEQPGDQQAAEKAIDGGLDVIVVTARKREESVQDTPISVTAFSGEALEQRGIASVVDVGQFTPNMQIDSGSAFTTNSSVASIYIRGIGQNDYQLSSDPGVGLYVDGVYAGRSIGANLDLLNIERIEVLRGPQGTLFGRNTVGGAVSVTTKKPDFYVNGKADVTYGADDLMQARMTVDVPFSDTLAANFSANYTYQDDYVKGGVAGAPDLGKKDRLSGRFTLRAMPSDNFEIMFSVDGSRFNEKPAPFTVIDVVGDSLDPAQLPDLTGASAFGFLYNLAFSGDPACSNSLDPSRLSNPRCYNRQFAGAPDVNYATFTTIPARDALIASVQGRGLGPVSDTDIYGGSLILDWNISDNIGLKSITAYRAVDAISAIDFDGSPLAILHNLSRYNTDQWTQEIQLSGTSFGGSLDWVLGGYYFSEDGSNIDVVDLFAIVFETGAILETESKSLFGQGILSLSDKLSLTVGARYTDEKKTFTNPGFEVLGDFGLGIPAGTPMLPPGLEATIGDKDFSPMASLSYDWTDNLMTYASYSEGYKGGGFTQRVFPPRLDVPTFEPERTTTYEAGFKFETAGRNMRLNGAVFRNDYKDLQVSVFEGLSPVFRNAAEARISGFELETQIAPTPGLLLEGGIGYLDAKYLALTPAAIASGLSEDFDLINAPEWSGSMAASYKASLGSSGSITPRVDFSFRSKTQKDGLNNPNLEQPAYGLVNASITYESEGGNWYVTGRIDNITDSNYLIAGLSEPINQGNFIGIFDRGRQWSLRVGTKF